MFLVFLIETLRDLYYIYGAERFFETFLNGRKICKKQFLFPFFYRRACDIHLFFIYYNFCHRPFLCVDPVYSKYFTQF